MSPTEFRNLITRVTGRIAEPEGAIQLTKQAGAE
jgi:hypothetical protein